jgi:site-specific DNA-methyltransferase (adenine-specific)
VKFDRIIQGDAAEILPTFPKDCIDLTVTSPPYGDARTYHGYEFDFERIVAGLFRVTKPGGVVVWVVGDTTVNGYKTGEPFRQALRFIKGSGFELYDTIIYQKNGPVSFSNNRYYPVHEFMFIFSQGQPKTINLIRDRKNKWYGTKWSNIRTRRRQKGHIERSTWDNEQGGEFGVRFNIWKYNVGAGYTSKDLYAFEHPALMPEKLARDCIISWSNPGDVVLDPLAGAGTTLKAAVANNRRYIGIEISPAFCDIAKRRVQTNLSLELTEE